MLLHVLPPPTARRRPCGRSEPADAAVPRLVAREPSGALVGRLMGDLDHALLTADIAPGV